MKQIIILLFLLIFSISFGQNQTRDVLYLKNGSIIKGSIIEMNPATGIKIKTADGSLFIYKMEEVLKTEKEEFISKKVNQKTSSVISQSTLEKVFKNYISQNRPALKFIGVSKVNGIKREVYGQKLYEIEYQLVLEPIKNIYINKGNSALLSVGTSAGNFKSNFSYSLQQVGGRMSAFGGNLTLIEKGKRIVFEGSLPFEETDNGWRATKFSNKSFKVVSSDYLTPEMSKRKAEERAKLVSTLKEKLDWKKSDVKPIFYEGKYFKVTDVPLFSEGHVKYFIAPLKSFYKGRNDVAINITKKVYESILASNRYEEIEFNSFKSADNSSRIFLTITNVSFPFINTGYQCKITIKGKVKGNFTNPKQLNFDYNLKPIIATSKSYKKNMSKQQALESALKNLSFKIQNFIYKNEPITLKLKRIETNKRGKAEKVVFIKPSKFISVRKIKFLVIAPNDITIKNNSFAISNKIGDCIYKGTTNGDEIMCTIRGNKNKKAFSNVKESTANLIGISIY